VIGNKDFETEAVKVWRKVGEDYSVRCDEESAINICQKCAVTKRWKELILNN
jgi:hypothetical protein